MIRYLFFFCFFFKQKTAYEMRISDWSSDVCSSDLRNQFGSVATTREHDQYGFGHRSNCNQVKRGCRYERDRHQSQSGEAEKLTVGDDEYCEEQGRSAICHQDSEDGSEIGREFDQFAFSAEPYRDSGNAAKRGVGNESAREGKFHANTLDADKRKHGGSRTEFPRVDCRLNAQ